MVDRSTENASGGSGIMCPNCGEPVAADARFCAKCGTALASTTAEERKLATILFADVMGSTDLGEQLDPERLRVLLHEYFTAMSRVIQDWQGTVEKYIGDAILAVFGVPTAREDDPVRALHAATEMLAQLERLNDDFETRHGVRVAVRIGVNTGEVLAPVGGRAGGQFLVSGDPVNVASRLQAAAEPGTVLVGERTWEQARNAFEFSEPITLTVKGKSGPVLARRLGRPTGSGERGVRFQAPMVGRDRELETLLGMLDEAVETEQPRLVIVSGAAGIGKSRMLGEFITAATERQPSITVLRGRCLAAGHGITFWALGEVLRGVCGISLDEPADSALEKLRSSVTAIVGPLGMRQADKDDTINALATSANLAVPNNPLDRQKPEAVAEAMALAWPRFLTGLASRAPTTIVFEDVHWADERMIGMLELLATRPRGPLVLIATARPEFLEDHPSFAANENLTVVSLRPLTEAQSELLVSELLGDSDPLQALLRDIGQKAEGNPFFLEEILQRLIDEQAIVREDGRWSVTEKALTIRLPDTIHALLAARIDGLPPEEKALLQQAAVVGRIFWPGSLGRGDAKHGAPVDVLRSLERRGLVSARPTSTIEGETEYIFRHVLIRDVAYASVPKARRAIAHAETARWIEELAADRLDEFGELLAYHYEAAVAGEDADLAWLDDPAGRERLRQRAFELLIRSGTGAQRRLAVEKAIALHEQALALATSDTERALAKEALGDDHEALFHMDEASAAYFDALDLVRAADDDPETIGRLAIKLGATAKRWGAYRETPPHGRIRDVVTEALRRDVSDRTRAQLLFALGSVTGQSPRRARRAPLSPDDRAALPATITSVREGLAIAERLDDPALLYAGNEALGLLAWTVADLETYRSAIAAESKLLDSLPSRREKVDALTSIAASGIESGMYRDGLAAAERAFELSEGLSPHERMHASFHVMWAAEQLGEWDRALEVLPWHVEAAAAEGDITCPNVRGGPSLGASLLIRRGASDLADELVSVDETALQRETLFDRSLIARYAAMVGRRDIAEAIVDQLAADDERMRYPDGMYALLEALALLGRDEQLREFIAHAREMSDADVILAPLADRAEAELLMKDGRTGEARALLTRALSRLEELGAAFEAARSRELLADVVDVSQRDKLLRDARATYERLGAKPFVERVNVAMTAPRVADS